jgi:hypothetical protein
MLLQVALNTNQPINYTNIPKQVLKVEQYIDLNTLFNIYTVVGTMYWHKIGNYVMTFI